MGKPFTEEIDAMVETYRWANTLPVDRLANAFQSLDGRPLYAVGSGGSLTTAELAATLYWYFESGFSTAITPVELASRAATLRGASVFVATAGGSNPDVLGAVRTAAKRDASVIAMCATQNSKVAAEAEKFSTVSVFDFDIPTGRDGFLASNSLLASAVLLIRAFAEIGHSKTTLPKSLSALVGARTWRAFNSSVSKAAADLWSRETLVVLFGPSTRPAAVDLESKLTEAALFNSSIADFRHFAHGRHHWLAKRGDDSSVLAFVSPSEKLLAEKTLAEIPSSIPRLVIDVPEGTKGLLSSIAHVFPLTLSAGQACGIDPGRPGVPSFGRRIYHINAYGRKAMKVSELPEREAVAIERKAGRSISDITRLGALRFWRTAYAEACDTINKGRYSAVIYDYDGTLCGQEERFTTCRSEIAKMLTSLLKSGIAIGIATGRGKSVRSALQQTLPKSLWKRVTIGYYNGGQIASLEDNTVPDGREAVASELKEVLSVIRRSKRLRRIADIEPRLQQITIKTSSTHRNECWNLLTHLVFSSGQCRSKLVCSTHSFDVLPAAISKLAVLEHFGGGADVLTVGDMGQWPGNDHELLSHSHSLSVDEVSSAADSCWNLASPGVARVEATLEYFARTRVGADGRLRLALRHKGARS